ncbi:MAG: methyltransferase cognate corrinoid protein [Candidatus Methanoplasma sp.]|jgi:trimethylamine corrinoid protein|nr:methyltransferase cognate corrinoid protein [Candidatus Methanoplasma sp.]
MPIADLAARAREAVMKYDAKASVQVANEAIAEKVNLVDLIQDGYTKGMTEVGDLFEKKKLYLPHIMAAAQAMTAGTNVLAPELEKSGEKVGDGLGTFAICTIEGDIHSIGKDIVAIMLKVAGFNVVNLGRDVPLKDIVAACKTKNPVGVGTSALMTSTMVNQKTLEEMLRKEGIREKLITNVGGAPVTQQWADEIGASVYTENASDAVAKLTKAVKAK